MLALPGLEAFAAHPAGFHLIINQGQDGDLGITFGLR
jgi:hypothetical protein